MTHRHYFCFAALLIVFGCLSPTAHADSWMPPKPTATYESSALDARFVVTSSGRPDTLFACSGALYVKRSQVAGAEWSKLWDKPLQNQLSPVTALVANGGWRVVTFDNYYSVGFGEEVIVFYDEEGNLLKKYSLEALLSEKELSQVSRSVSSRWWRSKVEIDEPLGVLKVEIGLNQAKKKLTKFISFNLLNGELLTP